MRTGRPSISKGWRQASMTWRATAMRRVDIRRVIDEHREFVAAEPRHRVARARALHQPVREAAQQLIAGAVPQAVVHGLEIVEVDEQHRRRHAVGDVPDRLVHAIGEQRAVGEQRQRIVECERAQLVVEPRGIGNVADVQRDAANRIHVAQVGDDHLVRTLLAFAPAEWRTSATCSECAARSTWSKTSRTCGASGPEHVVETLAGELARAPRLTTARTTGWHSGSRPRRRRWRSCRSSGAPARSGARRSGAWPLRDAGPPLRAWRTPGPRPPAAWPTTMHPDQQR